MDGRITHAPTRHERIAAVCRSLIIKYSHPVPSRPDYADLAEWLDVYLERECLLEQIAESNTEQTEEHRKSLHDRLLHAEAEISRRGL